MNKLKVEKYVPHRGLWMLTAELPKVRQEIKEKIEKLTYRDCRRTRIPLQEALMKDLYEDGCTIFSNYFKNILDKEYSLYYNKIIKKRLGNKKELEKLLAENFLIAERSLCVDQDLIMCLTVVLQTARLIELNFPDYKWLSKLCFEISLDILEKHTDGSNNEEEARIRYFFGKFCLEQINAYNDAITQLSISNNMSKGTLWLTSQYSNLVSYLQADSCYYLGCAYLAEANRIYKIHLPTALELSEKVIIALNECNVTESGSRGRTLYIEASLRRCQYLIRNSEHEATLKVHAKVQGLIYASGNPEYKCELFLQQGIYHSWLGSLSLSLRKFKNAVRLCEIHNLLYLKGLALVEIAKIYAKNNDTFNLVQDSLAQAQDIFQQINDAKNIRKVNYFSAILRAQSILPRFITLMKDADYSECDMLRLRGWKSYVRPFWTDEEEDKEFYKCIFHEMEYIEKTKFNRK